MPLKGEGMGKPKAFLCGMASGAVEPVFGFLTILLAAQMTKISSVFPVFCSWCDDLCCCGGTDPGSTGGRAYEYRNDRYSNRLCADDGARCGTWINNLI